MPGFKKGWMSCSWAYNCECHHPVLEHSMTGDETYGDGSWWCEDRFCSKENAAVGALLWLILHCAYVSDSAQDSTSLSSLCRDSLVFDTSVALLLLQFHYGVFFAYVRLREQEIRNLMWISECVAQNQKSRIHDGIVFIF